MNFMEMDVNTCKVPELKEAYGNLRTSLGEETFKQYKVALKRYFSAQITKIKFDEDARKLLCMPEQIHLHNLFLLSLTNKMESSSQGIKAPPKKPQENIEYMNCSSPQEMSWENGGAGVGGGAGNGSKNPTENGLPDEDLVKGHIYFTCMEYGLDGADDDVSQLILLAIQTFVKNIITCMASYVSGFKIRENNFQHAIGQAVPNPWLRNTNNILDPSQEINIEIDEDEAAFRPRIREPMEIAEQRAAHTFACTSRRIPRVNKLTLIHLYETLLFNPHVINCHSIHSIGLEKILSMLDCP